MAKAPPPGDNEPVTGYRPLDDKKAPNKNRPYQCYFDFQQCEASFPTAKDRKKHMKHDNKHDYCDKCDLAFDCWDSYVRHKAFSDKHLSCKFCGMDFKSVDGMKRHVQQDHPVSQNLPCLGCGEVFTRASAVVMHMEKGQCKLITAQQFLNHVQHKTVVNKVLENPEVLRSLERAAELREAGIDHDVGGGVSLNVASLADADLGQEQGLLQESLSPEISSAAKDVPRLGQRWPSLPETMTTRMVEREEALENIRRGVNGLAVSEQDKNPAMLKFNSNGSRPHEEPSSVSVWSQGGNSKPAAQTLFPNAKATPISTEWEVKLKEQEQKLESTRGMNILTTRYWDPSSKNYNPERFYNPVDETYICPFPGCDVTTDSPYRLELHIKGEHMASSATCPWCQRQFKTQAGLVNHFEAVGGRCKVRDTAKFYEKIDEISGGFLDASEMTRPDMMEPQYKHPMTFMAYQVSKPVDWDNEVGDEPEIGDRKIVVR